ncbi:ribonucleoside-diphosphate reductase, adenosylcobalamin-dependent [Candidatus Woesearchaeota archaeon CG10_big_fil_rev_8_21_14_0_10_34_8]|nr:MAG: ribonucleoside-diphosphate reductase, adenosylcobalamin-dependent [Candidatus Woesearchaeota archaeon CG10_big_fil_rev_8_21_14_0_10_34_8]
MSVTKIKKRDGTIVDFDPEKIYNAISKAAEAVGSYDREKTKPVVAKILNYVEQQFNDKNIPTIEDMQDIVERVLIEEGHVKTVKVYILYREEQAKVRQKKQELVGGFVDKNMSLNALKILKEKYLLQDNSGNTIETPEQMFRRVAKAIALIDKDYEKEPDIKAVEEEFFQSMNNLEFLPNSPCLMNAGTEMQQVISCFGLPINDSLEGIYDTLKIAAKIHKYGSGTGFNFSTLRPRDDMINSTKGGSSGALSFLKLFDSSTSIIKQGGKRRGANMAIIHVTHPEILNFISAKEDPAQLTNFNISIAITDKFMDAVQKNKFYDLINPRTKKVVRQLPAKEVFDLIARQAWKNGEPGVLFIDTINKKNYLSQKIQITSACAEAPLYENEACPLASLNVSRSVENKKINWEKIKKTIYTAVHFLDNMIDANQYPTEEIEKITKSNRKIGLGIMGFADMLFQLEIPYNSKEAVDTAEKLMRFIKAESRKASIELAEKRGSFPNYKESRFAKKGFKMRNATTTAVAPTGTISIIAGCSSGIEPAFALAYMQKIFGGEEILQVNKNFEAKAREKQVYTDELMKKIVQMGSLKWFNEIPADLKKIFVISYDVEAKWHVKIQAAFQKFTDNAVSKSVNLPEDAHKEDVVKVFKTAYGLGCKGITVYRDKSREDQIINQLN